MEQSDLFAFAGGVLLGYRQISLVTHPGGCWQPGTSQSSAGVPKVLGFSLELGGKGSRDSRCPSAAEQSHTPDELQSCISARSKPH